MFRKELLEIGCPVAITQDVIRGKWKLVILYLLKDSVKRFSELQRNLPLIRQGYLTQQLRELEQDGIIHREVYKVIPPKVEYSLTEMGLKFMKVMDAMQEWGLVYIDYLHNQEESEFAAGCELSE
ncbi:MAG TPA: helix-turn-helix domain-containing protein [Syntrophomonadaceae bacterium]|nr:helix-turn-helix domain-containing protein [Syntrophomonadaceae bacterium]